MGDSQGRGNAEFLETYGERQNGGERCAFTVVALLRWAVMRNGGYSNVTCAASAAGTEWHIRQRASYESAAPTMIWGDE